MLRSVQGAFSAVKPRAQGRGVESARPLLTVNRWVATAGLNVL